MNGRIDHNNYEAWLLDRLEGNLSPEQELELDAFLALHPDLAPADDGFPALIGISASLSEKDKESLKRFVPPAGGVCGASLDDHLIARLEGDLSTEQKVALEKFLYEHPEHAGTSRLYALTRLLPEALVFSEKRKLERRLPPEGMPDRFSIEDFLVARSEGDLSPAQENALQLYLKDHPDAVREWVIMSRARIAAETIAYPRKQELKKGGRVIAFRSIAVRLAAAASIAVLLGLGLWILTGSPDGSPPLAEVRKPVDVRKTPAIGTDATEATRIEVGTNGPGAQDPTSPAIEPTPIIPPAASPVPNETLMAANDPIAPKERASDPFGTIDRSEGPEQDPTGREEPQFAEQMPVIPSSSELEHAPLIANVEAVPAIITQDPAIASAGNTERGLGALVAATIRDKVLDKPAEETRPLDGSDALAMVDRGLKVVAGENAGVAMQRTDGRVRGFNIRVGNFAVSTGTGL